MHFPVEFHGIRIKEECLKEVQDHMKLFPSIRFLHGPKYDSYNKYWTIAIGGSGQDMNSFNTKRDELNWTWEHRTREKKSFWKRLFGNNEE